MGFPADVTGGAKTVLDAVLAANPTVLLQTYRARPARVGSTPCAWVDEFRANWLHDSGLRIWNCEVDVWLVDSHPSDAEEVSDRLDVLTSLVADAFTDAPHFAGANTVGEPVRATSGVVEMNGASYDAVIVTVGRIYRQEGR